ncbi:hypothetical protein BD289DRAFT_429422, partial [Coniella lustricola]
MIVSPVWAKRTARPISHGLTAIFPFCVFFFSSKVLFDFPLSPGPLHACWSLYVSTGCTSPFYLAGPVVLMRWSCSPLAQPWELMDD